MTDNNSVLVSSLRDFQVELDTRNALALQELNRQIDQLASIPVESLDYQDDLEFTSPPIGFINQGNPKYEPGLGLDQTRNQTRQLIEKMPITEELYSKHYREIETPLTPMDFEDNSIARNIADGSYLKSPFTQNTPLQPTMESARFSQAGPSQPPQEMGSYNNIYDRNMADFSARLESIQKVSSSTAIYVDQPMPSARPSTFSTRSPQQNHYVDQPMPSARPSIFSPRSPQNQSASSAPHIETNLYQPPSQQQTSTSMDENRSRNTN